MKKYGVLCLIPVLLFTLASCSGGSTGAVNVTASKVRADSPLSSASYSACLSATQEVTVVPRLSATVKSVNFKVGDSVKAGDVMFTLDSADVENQYSQAKAAYDMAAIGLENAKNGNAASTRLKLQQAVDTAQLGVNSATVSYNTAKDNYDKASYLESIGEVSASDFQQADNALAGAQCALDNAQLALKSAQENQQLTESTLIPEGIATAEKQVESARAALTTAQSHLDDTQIIAPMAGIISELEATAGELATAQTARVTILDPSSMDLILHVTPGHMAMLQDGMEVGVTLDDLSKEYTGAISEIAPSADSETGLFQVTIRLENAGGELKPGMPAKAVFGDEGEAAALYVPQQSVWEEDGTYYVYKISGTSVEKTAVTLGVQKDLYVQITEGLTADDTVVVEGADRVQEGSPVNVIKNID